MTMKVRPMDGPLGAEIEGVDLKALDAATFGAIENALHDHLVIVVRGQELQPADLVAFGRPFIANPDLVERLRRLESEAGTSAGALSRLRNELADTQAKLDLYDPVNIEQRSLREVRRVAQAVVFIETKTFFLHPETDAMLYVRRDGGRAELNFDAEGEPVALESSGSGFCVTDAGFVLTNAHVVESDTGGGFSIGKAGKLRPELRLAVVFSGTSNRRPAELVVEVHEGDLDLALLRIEPFEGMPFLPGIDLDLPVPEPGTEVYLCGFPLGTMALQAGETVIASTFKGILSRVVPPYLQVDAAVHPGNSGGPVMDDQGRILGIATRVQRTPDGPYAATIGYILPVAALKAIWPPPQ